MIKLKPLLPTTYTTLKTLITGLPNTQTVSSDLPGPSWTCTLTAPSNLNLNPYAFPSNRLFLCLYACDFETERGSGTRTTATVTVTNNTPYTIYLDADVLGTTVSVAPGATGSHTDVDIVYGALDEPATSRASIRIGFGNPQDTVQTYNVVSPLTI